MTRIGSELVVRSPAKINLFLEVTGKRNDGYHELDTVMARVSLSDVLYFRTRSGKHIDVANASDVSPLDFPHDETNLIVRAARALQAYTGYFKGVSVRVRKRIPAQAGLGGGSGNAAATLTALSHLWGLDLSAAELERIAAGLGSDVNFLLSGCRAAICTGRGEQVNPVPIGMPLYGTIVKPIPGNSTASVFAGLSCPETLKDSALLVSALRRASVCSAQRLFFNRLQQAGTCVNTEILRILTAGRQLVGVPGVMSGSGSACFWIFRTHAVARRATARLASLTGTFVRQFHV